MGISVSSSRVYEEMLARQQKLKLKERDMNRVNKTTIIETDLCEPNKVKVDTKPSKQRVV